MELTCQEISDWPPLAWLAIFNDGTTAVRILHGSRVESAVDRVIEGVWDGNFADGDFDQTDIVAGSGCRVRNGKLIFVSAGNTVDRLHHGQKEGAWLVSNSLACLVGAMEAQVAPGYGDYFIDFGSIINGLDVCHCKLATTRGDITLTYFDNLCWDGRSLERVPKPSIKRDFSLFEHYHDFLAQSLVAVAANMSDPARRHPWRFLSTLSSGYDSTAVTVLGVAAGCREAFTFAKARGGEADDGFQAAQALGIDLKVFSRDVWLDRPESEIPFICADAKGEDRYFCAAEKLLEGSVLLTGFHGDKLWAKDTSNLSENIVRGDRSGLSLAEYRLHAGFIHCPLTFWGVKQIRDLHELGNSAEMQAWDVPGGYSRPICRRIAEEAGIPRQAFGMSKRAASQQAFASRAFLTDASMHDYLRWMKDNRWSLIREGGLPLLISPVLDRLLYLFIRGSSALGARLYSLMLKFPGMWRISDFSMLLRLANWQTRATPMYLRRYVFAWALERSAQRYSDTNPAATSK